MPRHADMPGVIAAFFESAASRILSPEMGLGPRLETVTRPEVAGMAARLGISAAQAEESWAAAVAHQGVFDARYREAIAEASPRPASRRLF